MNEMLCGVFLSNKGLKLTSEDEEVARASREWKLCKTAQRVRPGSALAHKGRQGELEGRHRWIG